MFILIFRQGFHVLDRVECTSVTAGAVVWSLIDTLVAGVVTEVALPPHGVAARLAANVAAAFVKEPVSENDCRKSTLATKAYSISYTVHICNTLCTLYTKAE